MATRNFGSPEDTLAEAKRLREQREKEGRLLPNEALDQIAALVNDPKSAKRPAAALSLITKAVKATGR